jgi:hypothetical protein
MGALLRPSQPPMAGAKTLALTDAHVSRVISKPRKKWRDRSREIIAAALEGRATPSDFGEALIISERCARRALQLQDAAPFDWGDLLAFADYSPANLRAALRIHDAFGAELARIALKFHR